VSLSSVIILFKTGNDRVAYTLTGNLTTTRNISVLMGSGNDSFDAVLRRNLLSTADLSLSVLGQRGNDSLRTTIIGLQQDRSVFNLFHDGGPGDDTLTARSATFVQLGRNAFFNSFLRGAGGKDSITYNYQSRVDGSLSLLASGDGGADEINTLMVLSGTNVGMLQPSSVLGGGGNDKLRFVIRNTGQVVTINSAINGGGGFNECIRSTDVLSFRCERDTVI
jgi:hypothetical protein